MNSIRIVSDFWKSSALVISDFIITIMAFVVSRNVYGMLPDVYLRGNVVFIGLIYFLVYFLTASTLDLYTIFKHKKYDILISVVISCVFAGVSGMLVSVFVAWGSDINIKMLLIENLSPCAVLIVWRLMVNTMVKTARSKSKLLVVAEKDRETSIAKRVKYSSKNDWLESWYGFIDCGSEETINDFIENEVENYDAVCLTKELPHKVKEKIIRKSVNERKEIYVIPDMYDMNLVKCGPVHFMDILTFKTKPFYLTLSQQILKRILDIVVAFAAAVVFSPLMLICAVAVKIDSRGDILYRQKRVTINSREFDILKFRTMVQDAEKLSGPVLSTEKDPRVTRVGKLLRACRLDELPQIFNVLKGDMSIVGPRPERPVFVELYKKDIQDYDMRHLVKAGVTGYAQIYGNYDTDPRIKLVYDLLYIKEYSFWLDIKILIMTLKTMLTKEASKGLSKYSYKPPEVGNNADK